MNRERGKWRKIQRQVVRKSEMYREREREK